MNGKFHILLCLLKSYASKRRKIDVPVGLNTKVALKEGSKGNLGFLYLVSLKEGSKGNVVPFTLFEGLFNSIRVLLQNTV